MLVKVQISITVLETFQEMFNKFEINELKLMQLWIDRWNQSTIISLDSLNTFRIYFCTNSSLVHWCVRRQLTEYPAPACYSNLERALHMLLENV